MLIACIIAYNDADMLDGCLHSIKSVADRTIVADGAYRHFPHSRARSTDNTADVAFRHGADFIAVAESWPAEECKRNRYLRGNDGDYYLVIDTDERLIGEFPKAELLTSGLEVAAIQIDRPNVGSFPLQRIYRHQDGLHYKGTHYAMWAGNRLLPRNDISVMTGCALLHLTDERDNERKENKGTYYRHLQIKEAKGRQAYGI